MERRIKVTKQDIDFIKKANKFVVAKDNGTTEFDKWEDAVKYYNENLYKSKEIEISAICGMVGRTLAYRYATN